MSTISLYTENPKDDPKDAYDNMKWNIPETSLITYTVDGIIYKVCNTKDSKKSLKKLIYTRNEISRLCRALEKYYKKNHNALHNKELKDSIQLFLEIHNPKSGLFKKKYYYLLSEIPTKPDNPYFEGLNKPRGRFLSNEKNIGPDRNLRAMFKDIFLTLYPNKKQYKDLVLHELCHTACNHVIWRDDDHNDDFKRFYKLLDTIANEINFLNAASSARRKSKNKNKNHKIRFHRKKSNTNV
jgi:hypothetical protein